MINFLIVFYFWYVQEYNFEGYLRPLNPLVATALGFGLTPLSWLPLSNSKSGIPDTTNGLMNSLNTSKLPTNSEFSLSMNIIKVNDNNHISTVRGVDTSTRVQLTESSLLRLLRLITESMVMMKEGSKSVQAAHFHSNINSPTRMLSSSGNNEGVLTLPNYIYALQGENVYCTLHTLLKNFLDSLLKRFNKPPSRRKKSGISTVNKVI